MPGQVRPQGTARRRAGAPGRRHPWPDRLRAGHRQRRLRQRGGQPTGRGLSGAQTGRAWPPHSPRGLPPGTATGAPGHRRPQRLRRRSQPGGGGTGRGLHLAQRHPRRDRQPGPAPTRPGALVRLSTLRRQQPHRRPPPGLSPGRPGPRRQACLARNASPPRHHRPAPPGPGDLALPAARSGHGQLRRQDGQGPLPAGIRPPQGVAPRLHRPPRRPRDQAAATAQRPGPDPVGGTHPGPGPGPGDH